MSEGRGKSESVERSEQVLVLVKWEMCDCRDLSVAPVDMKDEGYLPENYTW